VLRIAFTLLMVAAGMGPAAAQSTRAPRSVPDIRCSEWKRLSAGQWSPLAAAIISREDFDKSELLPGAIRVMGPAKAAELERNCAQP
jgi:hypothetical protein